MKNKIAYIVGILVIAAMAGTIVFLVASNSKAKSDAYKEGLQARQTAEAVTRDVLVNESNVEEIVSSLANQEMTPVGYYEVTMNNVWNFEDGNSTSDNAYVENSTSNTNSVYFDVIRSDTDEVIYESPIMPVGTYNDKIKLKEFLEAGTYSCVCTYHLLDEENRPLSSVSVGVTVEVLN